MENDPFLAIPLNNHNYTAGCMKKLLFQGNEPHQFSHASSRSECEGFHASAIPEMFGRLPAFSEMEADAFGVDPCQHPLPTDTHQGDLHCAAAVASVAAIDCPPEASIVIGC
eukprot:261117-Pelagomonas_calceolata.AAC.7